MSNYVIGIDPDTDKHGVAVYRDGRLINLHSFQLMSLYLFLDGLSCIATTVVVSIEDIVSVSAIYSGRFKSGDNQAVKSMKAQNVGMCKHAQVEVERMCEFLDIQVVKQRPSKVWKDAKCRKFKLITGWDKRSNEDQRSAAYMGFQALNKLCKGIK